jgi:hypothetical protein
MQNCIPPEVAEEYGRGVCHMHTLTPLSHGKTAWHGSCPGCYKTLLERSKEASEKPDILIPLEEIS